jgi:hypothetical protein
LHARAGRWEPQRSMDERQEKRLTGRELDALFDRLFCTDSQAQTCSRRSRRKDGSVHRFWRAFTRLWSSFSTRESRFTATWKNGVASDAGVRARRHSSRGPNLRSKTCAPRTSRRR